MSAMSSEVIGCTTARSACGNTMAVMTRTGRMPRLSAASA